MKRNFSIAILAFVAASTAWAIGQASPQGLYAKIKNGSGTLNINSSGTVTVPNATVTLASDAAFTGDSGAGGVKGLVPAPASGDGAAGKLLRADGTWATPSGAGLGDFSGPASSHDNAAIVFNGTGGKTGKEATLTQHNMLTAGANNTFSSLAPGSAGNVATSDGTDWQSRAWDGGAMGVRNIGLSTSVGSSALTISLKQLDGSTNCSATAPCWIGFRNSTASTGDWTWRSVTGALSVVISSGSTLGSANGTDFWVHVYAIDNAGTVELAAGMPYIDEGSTFSTTAEGGAGAADSNAELYSTTARSSKAMRLIGRLKLNEATAGTYASNSTEVSLIPFAIRPVQWEYDHLSNAGAVNTSTGDVLTWTNQRTDNFNAQSSGTVTIPVAGKYLMGCGSYWTAGATTAGETCHIDVNGTSVIFGETHSAPTNSRSISCAGAPILYPMAKGDTVRCRTVAGFGNATHAAGGSFWGHWVSP